MRDPNQRTWVLVPVKAFASAKGRLAGELDRRQRQRLATTLATGVVQAAAPLPTAVVCDDIGVASWATDQGASVIWTDHHDLNGSVTWGVETLARRGADMVIVTHADLALPHGLNRIHLADGARHEGITLVPDRTDDGTNVIVTPARNPLRFEYGPQSFARHLSAAQATDHRVRVVRDPDLGWDVDTPEDLPPGWSDAAPQAPTADTHQTGANR